MIGYKTVTEIAKEWGISPRRVQILCSENRIKGVERHGKMWVIPDNSVKPNDAREKIKR